MLAKTLPSCIGVYRPCDCVNVVPAAFAVAAAAADNSTDKFERRAAIAAKLQVRRIFRNYCNLRSFARPAQAPVVSAQRWIEADGYENWHP